VKLIFSVNEEIPRFFMKPEDLLQPLQKPATSAYPKPG
jgi:hypothetical protein